MPVAIGPCIEASTMNRQSLVPLAAIAALSIACADSNSPRQATCPGAGVALCTAPPQVVTAASGAVADVATRSTKGLKNPAAKARLESLASALAAALRDGRVSAAREALDDMRAAIAEARSQLASHPGDAADLTAIELSIRPTADLLQ